MTTFDKREEGFEKKFAHDEELRFKATARRNKLLGLWAAEKLGKTGPDAEAYAREVVVADFQEAGDDDVLRKVRAALYVASHPGEVCPAKWKEGAETLKPSLDLVGKI